MEGVQADLELIERIASSNGDLLDGERHWKPLAGLAHQMALVARSFSDPWCSDPLQVSGSAGSLKRALQRLLLQRQEFLDAVTDADSRRILPTLYDGQGLEPLDPRLDLSGTQCDDPVFGMFQRAMNVCEEFNRLVQHWASMNGVLAWGELDRADVAALIKSARDGLRLRLSALTTPIALPRGWCEFLAAGLGVTAQIDSSYLETCLPYTSRREADMFINGHTACVIPRSPLSVNPGSGPETWFFLPHLRNIQLRRFAPGCVGLDPVLQIRDPLYASRGCFSPLPPPPS